MVPGILGTDQAGAEIAPRLASRHTAAPLEREDRSGRRGRRPSTHAEDPMQAVDRLFRFLSVSALWLIAAMVYLAFFH